MPPFTPGMNPDFAEQNSVSPANTHGLAVALGSMFFGRTERRLPRSAIATPLNSILAPPGNLLTWIVARAGVLPNSKRFEYCRFMTPLGIFTVRYGFTNT